MLNLSTADLGGADLLGAKLIGTDLIGAKLSGAVLTEADLHEANLSKADLIGADLITTKLISSDLRGAKLSRADFTRADLTGADLRTAIVSGASLRSARLVDARLNGANLRIANLRQADLTRADLRDADLSRANLNHANCSEAKLIGANLTETHVLGTNFTGAKLTKACLEDWIFNTATRLNDIVCDYVYLQNYEQKRYPGRGNFLPGEFSRLLQEDLNTFDLLFPQGISWEIFAYALKQIELDYGNTGLTIRSIENKGDKVLVVRISVSGAVDKNKLQEDFSRIYKSAHFGLELFTQNDLHGSDLQAPKESQRKTTRREEINVLFLNFPRRSGSSKRLLYLNHRRNRRSSKIGIIRY
ncbi:hypothetical protein BST81_03260 [Leptolyngbya sp. 'hensonii']|nr:pentapeptide repeat-containing protein [Leptolyngbya sp. 'hensonii']OLP19864.1 hypothetical protein BST81_03260 [Leptolyngbya sp. 'hensonii']